MQHTAITDSRLKNPGTIRDFISVLARPMLVRDFEMQVFGKTLVLMGGIVFLKHTWCWSEGDSDIGGIIMLLTSWWWLISDVGCPIIMLVTFFRYVGDFLRHTWCWSEGDSDIGDIVMLVTLWWWLISNVGGRIIMLMTFFVMLVILSMY